MGSKSIFGGGGKENTLVESGENSKSMPLKLMTSLKETRFVDGERVKCTTTASWNTSSSIQTNTSTPDPKPSHIIHSSSTMDKRPRESNISSGIRQMERANSLKVRLCSGIRSSKRFMEPRSMTIETIAGDEERRRTGDESGNASPTSSTPTTPTGTSKGHRFKLPAKMMGGFLFRKKTSWPSLNYAATAAGSGGSGTDEDRTQSSPAKEKMKRGGKRRSKGRKSGENTPAGDAGCGRRSPTLYNNISNNVIGNNTASETSPLIRRINNRLHLDRINRFSTASFPCQGRCYCPDEDQCPQRYRRHTSKEDPGPRTAQTFFNTGPIGTLAADTVVEVGGCGSGSGACNKSASYPTAFSMDGRVTVDDSWANTGTKYKLVQEGQIQVCRLNHPRTLLGKLTSSKLLRRWETHTLMLDGDEITSKTPSGFMEQPIKYSHVEDVHALPWDSSGDKHCVRIFVPEGSILLQTNHIYARNQWLFSIQWRKNLHRYRRVIESNCSRPEVILKEIKSMVELAMRTPLQGDHMNLKPVRLVCMVLKQINDGFLPKTMADPVLVCVAPILDTIAGVSEISPWLIKYCDECPRSRLIDDILSDVGYLTLKKNMDFGKYTSARLFVQEFLLALCSQNDGLERVKSFVRSAHGPASSCPHPRVLPNLVSVCLAAIHAVYDSSYGATKTSSSPSSTVHEGRKHHHHQGKGCHLPLMVMASLLCGDATSLSSGSVSSDDRNSIAGHCVIAGGEASCVSSPSIGSALSGNADRYGPLIRNRGGSESKATPEQRLSCFCAVLETMSEFEDWRLPLASLLQPIPFPDEVLANEAFAKPFGRLIRRIGDDQRCEVHLAVLGVREGKEGWFHLACPGGPACVDDGDLFASLLKTLLHCCCRRKKFLQSLNGMLGPLQLLSLRECVPAMEALCLMLEMEVVEGEDMKLQMITALQSTSAGKRHYAALCDRQIALRELQQKGGPRKLTLPSKSTDADLAVLLSSGSFGNLEWLSLAFTNVTSACAEYLIKLPSLRYLNLWSTQFGDIGLQTISEHLNKLQVLNLCETPVTDKGLSSVAALTNLRKLNLNSTQLSAKTFQMLQAKLPALQEVDVRYTDAWCADEFLSWSSS